DILFIFNVQHDCQLAKCEPTGLRKHQQERQESDNFECFVEHNAVSSYIVNLHSFHNAHLIREVLPRDLTKPL
ncbi:hypothetical protein K435DRAFT_606885, partial [Dendrothele bispora CBS 962.96]